MSCWRRGMCVCARYARACMYVPIFECMSASSVQVCCENGCMHDCLYARIPTIFTLYTTYSTKYSKNLISRINLIIYRPLIKVHLGLNRLMVLLFIFICLHKSVLYDLHFPQTFCHFKQFRIYFWWTRQRRWRCKSPHNHFNKSNQTIAWKHVRLLEIGSVFFYFVTTILWFRRYDTIIFYTFEFKPVSAPIYCLQTWHEFIRDFLNTFNLYYHSM